MAIFFTASVTAALTNFCIKNGIENIGYWFIYLTQWGILLCAFSSIFGAILVTISFIHVSYIEKIQKRDSLPVSLKIYWALHNTSLILSVLITAMYWTVVFDKERDVVNVINVLLHITNSIVMFIDLIIVAHPVRLLHCIHPIVVGSSYGLFTFIYYKAGGVTM